MTMFIVAVFMLGSGICGGASSGNMLIAGRAVQGIGSGGINMIVDVIVSDLVPLRERGNFIAIVLTVYALGTSIGPFVGGIIVQTTHWSWVFYINLPVGGAALVLLFLFLHVNYKKDMSFKERIKRIDFIGNGIIMASTVSVLMALTYAGSRYPWSSWRTLVPLLLGIGGLFLFMAFENSRFPRDPVTPPRLFGNRTSAIVFINTFLFTVLLYWVMYFLPVYFQGVLRSSPARTGVQLLPITLVAVPGAVIAVIVLSKFGKYRPLHHAGFAILTLGLGLFALLDRDSSPAEWILYQVVAALGSGMVLNTLLPAFQAGLPESDQAAATAAWSFIRSYGNIWGVAIPAAILNNRFEDLSHRISDPSVRALLSNGRAYEKATKDFVNSFPVPIRDQIISVFTAALKLVWEVSVVFAGLPFLLVFLEKQIPLRTELETDFGLAEKEKEKEEEKRKQKLVVDLEKTASNENTTELPLDRDVEVKTPELTRVQATENANA